MPFFEPEIKPNEPSDYKRQLFETLQLCKSTLKPDKDVIVVAFDAASTGRLSVAYYSEFKSEDFLARLEYWDETCCWFNRFGISSPYLSSIVKYAFGTQRGNAENAKIEIDERIEKQLMQRLIFCRLEKQIFPRDIMLALFNKSKNLQIYNKVNRANLLFAACAVIKKYHHDKFKEEWEMSLEKDKKDRSYQFGRLLAVLEKIESDVLRERGEERETSALRLQSVFVQRPAYAAKVIMDGLKTAYYPRLSAGRRAYYEAMIGEIFENLSQFCDDNYNKPLTETYLLGYYLQRNDMYKKKETKENTEVTAIVREPITTDSAKFLTFASRERFATVCRIWAMKYLSNRTTEQMTVASASKNVPHVFQKSNHRMNLQNRPAKNGWTFVLSVRFLHLKTLTVLPSA